MGSGDNLSMRTRGSEDNLPIRTRGSEYNLPLVVGDYITIIKTTFLLKFKLLTSFFLI